MTRAIGAAEAFDEWNAGEYLPGPGVESDDEIAGYIRESVSTWFHPVGTCRMGVGDDAVVDPKLARSRHDRAACRRRVDHAGHRLGEHERRLDDDRLACRRSAAGVLGDHGSLPDP